MATSRRRAVNTQVQSLVAWIIIGLIAGLIASVIVGTPGGLIRYLVAGLIGSVVGGFLARQLNIRLNFGNPFLEQVVIAIAGAIIVLIIAGILV
jgi:uncharacterized membrane protein YeaQ/YmgE (transglycosylase-associated protein family)